MIKELSQKLVDAAEKMMQEASDKQKEYRKFFDGMLMKYGVKAPSELSGDKKKEFFSAIEKGWTKDEQKEGNHYTAKNDWAQKEVVAPATTESNIPLPGTDEYEEENGLDEGTVIFVDHDANDRDFKSLTKKLGLKVKTKGDETTVSGNDAKISKMLKTMRMKKDRDGYAVLEGTVTSGE